MDAMWRHILPRAMAPGDLYGPLQTLVGGPLLDYPSIVVSLLFCNS